MKKASVIHLLLTSESGCTFDTGPYGYTRTTSYSYFNFCRASGGKPYHPLGNGRRFYHTAPMRFLQPDTLGPFGPGGLSSYAYCLNDPINRNDPTGAASVFGQLAGRVGKLFKRKPPKGLYERPNNFSLKAAEALENHQPAEIFRELEIYQQSSYKGRAVFITDEQSLANLKNRKQYLFAMSREGKIVASPWDWRNHIPTHAALASELKSREIISAGVLKRKGKKLVRITNNSGHFKPDEESLDNAAWQLSSFGVSVQIKPWKAPEPWRNR